MQPDGYQSPNRPDELPAPVTAGPVASAPVASKKKRNLKLIGIIAGVLVLLIGATAAAYLGVIAPNQPENVLAKSVENTLKLKQVSGKGSLNFSTGGQDSRALVVNYSLKSDSDKNAASAVIDAAYSGAKLPLEVRAIDKSVFIRVGDLGSIKGALELYSPGSGAFIDQVSKAVSNQWIEIDESLLSTASSTCSAESLKLSDNDIKQIFDTYNKSEFATIKNSSEDKIDGRSVTKMELDFSKEKAKKFGEELEKTELFSRLEKCGGEQAKDKAKSSTDEEFKGSYSFVVWVDKSKKELVKFAVNVRQEDKGETNADFTFNKDKVDITKPDGAKPAMEVLGQLGPVLGGLMGGVGGQ